MMSIDRANHSLPGKLWSLLDMLKRYAEEYFLIAQAIAEVEKLGGANNEDIRSLFRGTKEEMFSRLKEQWPGRVENNSVFISLQMPSVQRQIERCF